jgi:AraC family transcriptional regulator, 4-hydroxyphenylacetate 3-monooxygenase operon regulatory protein
MARSQFTWHCRNLTNRTPMHYLADCRIEAAKSLLAVRPDLNVSDIAGICGFQTSQYFATQFRKRVGQAPAEFRKKTVI